MAQTFQHNRVVPTQTAAVWAAQGADGAPLAALWPAVLLPPAARAHVNALTVLSPTDLAAMADAALRHGVGPLLYGNLQEMPLVRTATSPEMAQLQSSYRQSALLALQRSAELCRILDALAGAGVRPAVFKGAALAHTLYASPACRPMGDVDLWVTDAEMPTAVASLTALGYIPHENEHRPHALTRRVDGEVQMRPGRPGQSLVELHWGVFPGEWLAHTAAVDRAGVRRRLVAGVILNRDVLLLAPEDALIQLAVHLGINHQLTLNSLRSMVDVALVAEQGVDWQVVIQRAQAWRVATVVGLVLDLTSRLFDLPALAAPATALAPGALHGWLLRRFATPEAILAKTEISADRGRFVYLLLVADSPRASLRLLAHTLWPESAWLAARYGRSGWPVRFRHTMAAMQGKI